MIGMYVYSVVLDHFFSGRPTVYREIIGSLLFLAIVIPLCMAAVALVRKAAGQRAGNAAAFHQS